MEEEKADEEEEEGEEEGAEGEEDNEGVHPEFE